MPESLDSGLTSLSDDDVVTTARNCEKHGEYTARCHKIGTIVMTTGCKSCQEEEKEKMDKEDVEEQNRKIATIKASRLKKALSGANIPLRFNGKSFSNYEITKESEINYKICKSYAEKFLELKPKGTSLVMAGNTGTGKTHLSTAIANNIMTECGFTTAFMNVVKAVRRVKETYGNREKSEQEALDSFLEPDLLILDEVGVQFGSDTERMILFEIINSRYENMKPSILIGNLTIEEMENYLGSRIIDRMRENGGKVLSFNWRSKRQS